MYLFLRHALDDKKISSKAVSALLGVSEKTLYNKMVGATAFTIDEARTIRREMLPEFDLDYLFTQSAQAS